MEQEKFTNSLLLLALLLISLACLQSAAADSGSLDTLRRSVEDLIYDEKYVEAEVAAKHWLEVAERSGDQSLAVGDVLEALVKIYAGLRRYDDAEAVWRRCVELRVKSLGPRHALVSKTIDVMTGIYVDQGRAADAQRLWREGLAAFQKRAPVAAVESLPNPPDLSGSLVPGLLAQGRLKEAERVLRQKGDNASLAVLLLDQGRQVEAAELHRGVLSAAPTAERAVNIAALYRQRDLPIYEQEFLKSAIDVDEHTIGPEHPELISILSALASSFERQSKYEEAYQALKRATEIATIVRMRQTITTTTTAALKLRQHYLDFLRVAARLTNLTRARRDVVIDDTFEAGQLATETRLNIILSEIAARLSKGTGSVSRIIRKRQDLEREWQRLDHDLLSAVTEMATLDRRNDIRSRLAAVDRDISATDETVRRDFPQYFDIIKPIPLSIAGVQSMLQPNEALVQFAALGKETFVWAVTRSGATWAHIGRNSVELKTLASKLRCGLDYASWKAPSECSALLNRTYTPADAAAGRPLPFDFEDAYVLYEILFGQIEGVIADKHLLVVLSGPLSSLPLQVLVTKKNDAVIGTEWSQYSRVAWLAKTNAMTVLPSVATLKTLRRYAKSSAAPYPYVAFANPVLLGHGGSDVNVRRKGTCISVAANARNRARPVEFTRSDIAGYFRGELADVERVRTLNPLVETADEVCAVAAALGASEGDIYLADRATELNVKSLSKTGALQNYRIVHFATHGMLASEAEIIAGAAAQPALVLSPPTLASPEDDGLLMASEVAQLRLNADWVILSACNTAGGDRTDVESLSGLAQAFFYAGTRSVLVSHWAVDSGAAAELITRIFEKLRSAGSISRAEALRKAMVDMVEGNIEEARHPAYWAPFVLVGEGGA